MTDKTTATDTEFAQEWRAWRSGWEQFLTQPYGWLSVVSINWVDETPTRYPGQPGLWWQEGDKLCVDPEGQTMSYDGESFTSVRRLDLSGSLDDVRITAGDLQVGVTYRGQYLLVNHDPQAAARTGFHGVPTFEPDPRWEVKGQFEAHATPTTVSFASVGTDAHVYPSPGVVRFSHAGSEHTLILTSTPQGGMAAVFADATSGVTTYGACRTVMVSEPDEAGTVVLDFNRALNLPCAFNTMPVCPAAPPENRLPFAIEAGEKIPHGPSK